MPLPEGWEWIEEVPSGWTPPEELRVPTGIVRLDLPIMMLSSGSLGNDLIDLVGQLLSEGSRFSMWFAVEAKKKVSPKDLAILSMTVSNQLQPVYEAWKEFIDAYESSGRKVGTFDSEESELKRSLLDAISNIAGARKRFDDDVK